MHRLIREIQSGERLLHRTTTESGELLCFSLEYIGLTDVLWLSYVATVESHRSKAVGTEHCKRLVDILKLRFPDRCGLLIEIEWHDYPQTRVGRGAGAKLVEASKQTLHYTRQRLAFFTEKCGATPMSAEKPYWMPSFRGGDPVRGLLLWVEFAPGAMRNNVVKQAVDEAYRKIYRLPDGHELFGRNPFI